MTENDPELAWVVIGVPPTDLPKVIENLGEYVTTIHTVKAIATSPPVSRHLEESSRDLQFNHAMVSFYPGSSAGDLIPVVTREDLIRFLPGRNYTLNTANGLVNKLRQFTSNEEISSMLYTFRRGEAVFYPLGIRVDSLLPFVEQLETRKPRAYKIGERSISMLRDFCIELFLPPSEERDKSL